MYIGDIRADEGLRIRADNICPCLHGVRGGYLTNVPVIIEVNMIRDIRLLGGGKYIADFRYDEGIRVREEFISPTLVKSQRDGDGGLSNQIFLIEVNEDGMEADPNTCREE